MYGKLIVEGNNVYEVDEECLKKKRIPPECGVREAIERQLRREKEQRKS